MKLNEFINLMEEYGHDVGEDEAEELLYRLGDKVDVLDDEELIIEIEELR